MRMVLAGGYDTQNLGDHAMLQVLMRDFERRGERVVVLPDPAFGLEPVNSYAGPNLRRLDPKLPVLPLSCEADTDYMARSLGIEDCCIDLSDGASSRPLQRALNVLERPQSAGRALQERCRRDGAEVSTYADAILALGQARFAGEGVPA